MTAPEWIEWNGGECPVTPETMINFRTRFSVGCRWRADCDAEPHRAGDLGWGDEHGEHNIIAYRVIDGGDQ